MPRKKKSEEKPQVAGTTDTEAAKKPDVVNVIVTVPKAFRCFEPATGRMYYEQELIRMGVGMTPTGSLFWVTGENAGRQVLGMFALWNTSQKDDDGQALYEGDICEVGVETEFGSLVERVGIMRWSVEQNNFSIHFNGRNMFAGGVRIKSCRKIGNEFQDKEAGLRYKNDNE